ncbi:hypothetical protein CTAYLR_008850 [Chrysophaeum taylorii]|uniref:Glycosyltransferase n=1 Tax=Chrysophaeum taylorii TaxID=2483200 RepID=A0AAD7UQ39_9STRA|nr:hypothetical protein CTAYLR_008850 [Chrysophaeum taylorii]
MIFVVVGLFLVGATAMIEERDVCPTRMRDAHLFPRDVFYTGLFDSFLWNSTLWPVGYRFHFFDNEQLEASARNLSAILERNNVTGLYEAFTALRPWAFKSDLWRYAILWACGGFYVDSKMKLRQNMDGFLERSGWEKSTQEGPLLISCRDLTATAKDRFHNITAIWQGFIVSEPRHPDLIKVLRSAIDNVLQRRYFEDEGVLRMLYITGPNAMARAIQTDPDWHKRVKLPCRWGNHGNELRTVFGGRPPGTGTLLWMDQKLHNTLRNGAIHSYSNLYKAHRVYVDDPPCAQNCHLITDPRHHHPRLPEAPR